MESTPNQTEHHCCPFEADGVPDIARQCPFLLDAMLPPVHTHTGVPRRIGCPIVERNRYLFPGGCIIAQIHPVLYSSLLQNLEFVEEMGEFRTRCQQVLIFDRGQGWIQTCLFRPGNEFLQSYTAKTTQVSLVNSDRCLHFAPYLNKSTGIMARTKLSAAKQVNPHPNPK